MDAPVALALMAKAKRVFEHEQTFLSFPVAGQISYQPEDFNFVTGGVSTNADLLKLSEFCRLVNLVPDGPVWPPGDERYLWNVYEDVMKANVRFAASTRTTQEEEEYQKAFHLLYEVGEDGLRRDTAMVLAYNQYRDAWFAAREDYNSHKVEAELTDDPPVKAHWEQVLEPQLRAEIDSVESDWRVKGFRDQVDEARRVEGALGSKSPVKAWQTWDQMFDRDIDIQTDTSNQRYVLSGISPSNALQASGWLRFTLTGAEADQLVSEAPAELRDRLSPNPVDMEIDSISFEYTSVAISRPWLPTDLFKARFWRFGDPSQALSDGATPPSGLLPAYVAALAFARNPVVKLKENSARNQKMFERVPADKALSLGMFNVAPVAGRSTLTVAPQLRTAAEASALQPAQQARLQAALRRVAVKDFTRISVRPGVAPSPTVRAATVARDLPTSPTMIVRDHRAGPPVTIRDHRLTPLRPDRPTIVVPVRPGAGETPPSTSPPPPAPDDSIYILAFICKKLPKCPDPDPSLTW